MEKVTLKKAILAQAIKDISVHSPEPVLEMAVEPMIGMAIHNSNTGRRGYVKEVYPGGEDNSSNRVEALRMELFGLNENSLHRTVDVGSIVFTNKGNFLAGIATDTLEVNRIPVKGIDSHTPLFAAMKGKKRGEQFQSHRELFRIWDVF